MTVPGSVCYGAVVRWCGRPPVPPRVPRGPMAAVVAGPGRKRRVVSSSSSTDGDPQSNLVPQGVLSGAQRKEPSRSKPQQPVLDAKDQDLTRCLASLVGRPRTCRGGVVRPRIIGCSDSLRAAAGWYLPARLLLVSFSSSVGGLAQLGPEPVAESDGKSREIWLARLRWRAGFGRFVQLPAPRQPAPGFESRDRR